MQKKEDNGFVFLKPETDDDFSYLAETIALLFYRDADGILHCLNHVEELEAAFIDGKWVPVEYSSGKRPHSDVPFDSTWKEFKEKGLSPVKAMNESRYLKTKKWQEEFMKARSETKHKVIGWDEHGYGLLVCDDENASYSAALVNDIVEKDYFFCGDQTRLRPVFEDYTIMCLSDRGMGGIMAYSKGDYSPMGYAHYAWSLKYDEDGTGNYNLPKMGAYKRADAPVELSGPAFADLFQMVACFYDGTRDPTQHLIYFLVLKNDREYFTGKDIHEQVFVNKDGPGKMSYRIDSLCLIRSEKEFEYAKKDAYDTLWYDEEDIIFIGNEDVLEKLLEEDGEAILMSLFV